MRDTLPLVGTFESAFPVCETERGVPKYGGKD